MGWSLKEKPKTYRVTRKLAEEVAAADCVPNERLLSERRLQVYERLLRQGGFRPVTWAKAYCKETGGIYRVNGQHTSILLSRIEPLPEFYVTMEEYNCDTLHDVAELYATFDSKMQSRTASDINMSFAGAIPELRGCPRVVVNLLVSGMGWQVHQAHKAVKTPTEKAELLFDHLDFVLWCWGILTRDQQERGNTPGVKHITRAPVVAAMMGTWKKAQADSGKFWQAVRDETGENPNLPDRKLAKFLTTCFLSRGRGTDKARRVDDREMYCRCLVGWNAWRKGESTTSLAYYADKDIPAIK